MSYVHKLWLTNSQMANHLYTISGPLIYHLNVLNYIVKHFAKNLTNIRISTEIVPEFISDTVYRTTLGLNLF